MDWYIVIKAINGRRYRYRQKTWREGKRVRTRSEYIGPANDGDRVPHIPNGATTPPLRFPTALPLPAFNPSITDDAFRLLTERDASDVQWEVPWEERKVEWKMVDVDLRVDQILKNLQVAMTDKTTGAFYSPSGNFINIPPQECFRHKSGQTATQAYHLVLFHELVHWTNGRGRLKRRAGVRFFDHMWYAREELVAELGAIMLMQHLGIEIGNPMRHAKYFQGWIRSAGAEKKALSHAKREAARAVRYLLERGIIQQ
jgi:hypothetical protein